MSNALFLGPAATFTAGTNGYNITLTPTGSTSLVGSGGCYFTTNDTSISLYANYQGNVYVSGSGSSSSSSAEFVAVFGANTSGGTATGTVTLDNPINADLMIGNINESVTVIAAGQTSGTFSIPLPVGGADLSPKEAKERFKANLARAKAGAAH